MKEKLQTPPSPIVTIKVTNATRSAIKILSAHKKKGMIQYLEEELVKKANVLLSKKKA